MSRHPDDVTARLRAWADEQVPTQSADLSGYLLSSPTPGVLRAPTSTGVASLAVARQRHGLRGAARAGIGLKVAVAFSTIALASAAAAGISQVYRAPSMHPGMNVDLPPVAPSVSSSTHDAPPTASTSTGTGEATPTTTPSGTFASEHPAPATTARPHTSAAPSQDQPTDRPPTSTEPSESDSPSTTGAASEGPPESSSATAEQTLAASHSLMASSPPVAPTPDSDDS